jgi:hypothetical protein
MTHPTNTTKISTMDSLDIAGFNLPYLPPHDGRCRILATYQQTEPKLPTQPGWNADFFGLERVRLFQDSTLTEQQAILWLASRDLIEEAYCIEQAGVGYMAKMVLLAESVEERTLYGLFTADETLHLNQISAFRDQQSPKKDAFLEFLAEVLTSSDKPLLLFVLQVVLEGWGLSHYRSLAKSCCHPPLANLFQSFLQAESRHHAAGVIGFQAYPSFHHSEMVEVLAQFLQMIRVGPQRLLTAMAEVKGDLSRHQQQQILEQLDTETHSGIRLLKLKSLMQTAGGVSIVEQLEARNLFQPLAAQWCLTL